MHMCVCRYEGLHDGESEAAAGLAAAAANAHCGAAARLKREVLLRYSTLDVSIRELWGRLEVSLKHYRKV